MATERTKQVEQGRYRKRPVKVSAMRVEEIIRLAINEGPGGMPEWLVQAMAGREPRLLHRPHALQVRTKQERLVGAGPDEWIVCAAPDDLWPVDADVFEETYEPA